MLPVGHGKSAGSACLASSVGALSFLILPLYAKISYDTPLHLLFMAIYICSILFSYYLKHKLMHLLLCSFKANPPWKTRLQCFIGVAKPLFTHSQNPPIVKLSLPFILLLLRIYLVALLFKCSLLQIKPCRSYFPEYDSGILPFFQEM